MVEDQARQSHLEVKAVSQAHLEVKAVSQERQERLVGNNMIGKLNIFFFFRL